MFDHSIPFYGFILLNLFPGEEGTGGVQKQPLDCAMGHYCPSGTGSPTQFPCAAGSYTNKTNLKAQDECTPCTRGWFCLEGSSSPTDLCFTGHWCPESEYNLNILNVIKEYFFLHQC